MKLFEEQYKKTVEDINIRNFGSGHVHVDKFTSLFDYCGNNNLNIEVVISGFATYIASNVIPDTVMSLSEIYLDIMDYLKNSPARFKKDDLFMLAKNISLDVNGSVRMLEISHYCKFYTISIKDNVSFCSIIRRALFISFDYLIERTGANDYCDDEMRAHVTLIIEQLVDYCTSLEIIKLYSIIIDNRNIYRNQIAGYIYNLLIASRRQGESQADYRHRIGVVIGLQYCYSIADVQYGHWLTFMNQTGMRQDFQQYINKHPVQYVKSMLEVFEIMLTFPFRSRCFYGLIDDFFEFYCELFNKGNTKAFTGLNDGIIKELFSFLSYAKLYPLINDKIPGLTASLSLDFPDALYAAVKINLHQYMRDGACLNVYRDALIANNQDLYLKSHFGLPQPQLTM